jgi:hypothetical protein
LATAAGIFCDKLALPKAAAAELLVGSVEMMQMRVVVPAAVDPAGSPRLPAGEDGSATSSPARRSGGTSLEWTPA